MENSHSAFLAGEYVQVRSLDEIEEIEKKYANAKDWELNPYALFPKNMKDFANKRLQIVGVSYWHLGFVLYELREIGVKLPIDGLWPEKTLADQELDRADESPLFQLANQIYQIVKTKDAIEIRGRGRTYCALRKFDIETAFIDISRVASLRCAASFSQRYNFDGIEYQEVEKEAD